MKYLFNLSKILSGLSLITFCYGMDKEIEIEGHTCSVVSPCWYYSPSLIDSKKQSYEHLPLMQYQPFNGTTTQEIIEVPMGEIKKVSIGENKILYTKGIFDCIGLVIIGPESISLGHISYDPHASYKSHTLLDDEVSKLANKDQYNVFLTSCYYSDNLDKVISILNRNNVPIRGIDISDAYADYTAFIKNSVWGFPHFHFATKKHGDMQIHVLTPKDISVCAQTQSISNKVPKQ